MSIETLLEVQDELTWEIGVCDAIDLAVAGAAAEGSNIATPIRHIVERHKQKLQEISRALKAIQGAT